MKKREMSLFLVGFQCRVSGRMLDGGREWW